MKKNIFLIGLFVLLLFPSTEVAANNTERSPDDVSSNSTEQGVDIDDKSSSTTESIAVEKNRFTSSAEFFGVEEPRGKPNSSEENHQKDCTPPDLDTKNQSSSSSGGNLQQEDPTINFRSFNASDVTSNIYYTPENRINDPWKNGNIVLENNYTVDKLDIAYNAFFKYELGLSIINKLPKEISPTTFINSLNLSNSYIVVGNQKKQLAKSDFTEVSNSPDKVKYTLNSSSFDLWSLINWIWHNIIYGGRVNISYHIELNVAQMGQKNPFNPDKTIYKLITTNKLPVSREGKLSFTTDLYGLYNQIVQGSKLTTILSTWNNYISPWNEKEAGGDINGKEDDTQEDHTEEVIGQNRVLKGENYQKREVLLPITQEIDPNKYIRVVNLFSKTAKLGEGAGKIIATKDENYDRKYEGENGEQVLERTSHYTYKGQDNEGVALSPVSINFLQRTRLNLSIKSIDKDFLINEPITFTGILTSEGKNNQFYYQLQNGPKTKIDKVEVNEKNQVKLTIPGLSKEGDYKGELIVTNEYGLERKISIAIHVVNPKIEFNSVTDTLDFGIKEKIPNPGDEIYAKNPFSIKVIDTFSKKKEWKVLARIKDPFETEEKDSLPGTLYIHKKNETPIALSDTTTLLYENNKSNQGIVPVVDFKESNSSQGLFLKMVNSNVKINSAYKGTIEFEIQKGP